MEPYAANYGGHQFGQWAGQLGDGRAITLGEVVNAPAALGAAAEGRGPDPVLARGRRPRRAAIVAPRVPLQRGDAPPRRADDARAEPGADRRQVLRDMFYDGNPRSSPARSSAASAPSFIRFGNFELPPRAASCRCSIS
jgi:hypothetical protein